MSKKIEMIEKKFEKLLVVKESGKDKRGKLLYECKCDCSNISIVLGEHLRSGHSKSCGCLKSQLSKEKATTHGMSKTTTYKSWCHVLERCNNLKDKAYFDYGGRGIKVCKRWLKFENFFEDMGIKPKGYTIERIDNSLGYFKENCKYATPLEQSRNKRVYKTNKTGISGIYLDKRNQKYQVSIGVNHKQFYIGIFQTLKESTIARKKAERKYWSKE